MFEATDEALREEERAKERLCQELNMLVQQSASAQLEKLEQARTRASLGSPRRTQLCAALACLEAHAAPHTLPCMPCAAAWKRHGRGSAAGRRSFEGCQERCNAGNALHAMQ